MFDFLLIVCFSYGLVCKVRYVLLDKRLGNVEIPPGNVEGTAQSVEVMGRRVELHVRDVELLNGSVEPIRAQE